MAALPAADQNCLALVQLLVNLLLTGELFCFAAAILLTNLAHDQQVREAMLQEEILPVLYGTLRAAELTEMPAEGIISQQLLLDRGMKRMSVASSLELLERISRQETVSCQQLARAGGLRTMCMLLSSFVAEVTQGAWLFEANSERGGEKAAGWA